MANIVRSESLGTMYSDDRYEMTSKRRKMIHRDIASKKAMGVELPFEIGIFKPKLGNKVYEYHVECPTCGHGMFITKRTTLVICKCGEMVHVHE